MMTWWRESENLLADLWKLTWVGFLGSTLLFTGMAIGGWPVWLALWLIFG